LVLLRHATAVIPALWSATPGTRVSKVLPGSKSLQQFRAGLVQARLKTWFLMVRREDRVLFVSSETFGRTNKT